jgi:Na+-translocating ferredoxin:NAD+ oxidoreductase RnfE subunit
MTWSRDRSVVLSQVSTRVIMGLGVVLGIVLPLLCTNGFFVGRAFVHAQNIMLLMPAYYAFCVPAYTALVALDRLLAAVKRGQVFTEGNVRRLRVISWACFAAALVLAISAYVSLSFFALALIAAFFGVVLRAMKNLFAAAVALQDDYDHTI